MEIRKSKDYEHNKAIYTAIQTLNNAGFCAFKPSFGEEEIIVYSDGWLLLNGVYFDVGIGELLFTGTINKKTFSLFKEIEERTKLKIVKLI